MRGTSGLVFPNVASTSLVTRFADRFKVENITVLDEELVGVVTEKTSCSNLQTDYVVVIPR